MTSDNSSKNSLDSWVSLLSEVRPLLNFARRWWGLAVVMVLLSLAVSAAYTLFKGVQYEVNATLLYQLGPELAPPPTMTRDPLMITRRAEDVNDEIEILTSPALMHSVVEDLGEVFFTAPLPTTRLGKLKKVAKDAIGSVKQQIENGLIQVGLRRRLGFLQKVELALNEGLAVELIRDSDVISVSLETPDPDAGELLLEKLLAAYQQRHLEIHQEFAVKDFFGDQRNQLRDQLTQSRDALLVYQKSNDLWSSTDQQTLLLENRKSSQQQVASTTSEVARLMSQVAQLETLIEDMPAIVELSSSEQTNPSRVSLGDRLATLNLTSAVVQANYQPGTVEQVSQDRQRRVLQKARDDESPLIPHTRTEGINRVREDLVKDHAIRAAELVGLTDQLVVQETQLDTLNRKMQTLGEAIANYQHLEREHQLLEQKYALYVENFEKADIASVMNLAQISNVELISAPTASLQPTKPRLKMVAGIGVASGLLLAIVIAVIFDLRSAAKRVRESLSERDKLTPTEVASPT